MTKAQAKRSLNNQEYYKKQFYKTTENLKRKGKSNKKTKK